MFSRSEYRNQLSVIATATWYHLAWADIAILKVFESVHPSIPNVHRGTIKNSSCLECERTYMGVSKNRGTPKWMVYNGKPC